MWPILLGLNPGGDQTPEWPRYIGITSGGAERAAKAATKEKTVTSEKPIAPPASSGGKGAAATPVKSALKVSASQLPAPKKAKTEAGAVQVDAPAPSEQPDSAQWAEFLAYQRFLSMSQGSSGAQPMDPTGKGEPKGKGKGRGGGRGRGNRTPWSY